MLEIILLFGLLAILALSLYAIVIGVAPVPTPRKVAKRMIALANIKPKDKLYDLGCGDGRLVFAAAKQGAQATGIEISPLVCLWAYLRKLALQSPARILWRDILFTNISDADIVFLYLYPPIIKIFLERKFRKELKPGTKIISYAFDIKGLKLIKKEKVGKYNYIFVYQK